MASPELSQAIAAEQELLQEFGGAQTPKEFRWQFFPFLPEARQSTDRIGQFIREHTS